ncbi:MAG: helix-turn-helix domain-containing protein [Lachnospiraceae bacterium]|nr:helix-turn-helix domain-containing protein [Lachnospiraceae bacterium]
MKNQQLATKLKELRKALGYTQYDAAEALGVVRQTYSHYETGKRVPNSEILFKLAGLYKVSVDDLIQLVVDVDRDVSFDVPKPTASASELSAFIDYLNKPNNKRKCQFLSNREKELLFFYEQLSEKDKKEIVEIIKIKLKNG